MKQSSFKLQTPKYEKRSLFDLYFFWFKYMFSFHSLLPREKASTIISQSFCWVSTRNQWNNTRGSRSPRHTPPLLQSKPWLWNQLTDWRAFRARISLSSQMTLSLWTREAICCSISNLKETKTWGKIPSFWSQRVHQSSKPTPPRKKRQCHNIDSIPVSIKGLIAEANARVDQRGATMNRQKIVIWIKTSPSAGSVSKHRVTATITVATALHFQSWNDILGP